MISQNNHHFDTVYLYTVPGIVKVVQILLNLMSTITISLSSIVTLPHGISFLVVSVGGLFITGLLFGFYVYCACMTCTRIPWLKVEFVYCFLWTIACATVASVAADIGRIDDPFLISSVFAYFAMIAYGYDAFIKFDALRSGDSTQQHHKADKCFLCRSPTTHTDLVCKV
jgi:hypothetical protein